MLAYKNRNFDIRKILLTNLQNGIWKKERRSVIFNLRFSLPIYTYVSTVTPDGPLIESQSRSVLLLSNRSRTIIGQIYAVSRN